MPVLLNPKVVFEAALVPLFATVMFLVAGGRIPSLICDPETLPFSVLFPATLLSAVGDSTIEASGVGVGIAGSSLLAPVGESVIVLNAAVLVTGKNPVPLVGCKGPPVPVASAMLRVMVRVAGTVVVRVKEDEFFAVGVIETF